MEPYKTFYVPFDSTKLNLFIRNDPVKNREKIANNNEEGPNNSESSIDKKKDAKEKLWHQFVAKSHYLKNISRHKS